MTYKLPPAPATYVTDADYICSERQRNIDLTYALVADPGQQITLRYQENGHITLPDITPGKMKSGEVYVYGTFAAQSSHTLRQIHHVWPLTDFVDSESGFLLTQSPFDDGRCYQINNGSISRQRQAMFPHPPDPPEGENVWCGTNLTIPSAVFPCSAQHGQVGQDLVLSLYWVWEWPGTATHATAEQFYTTCLDVVVRGAGTQEVLI